MTEFSFLSFFPFLFFKCMELFSNSWTSFTKPVDVFKSVNFCQIHELFSIFMIFFSQICDLFFQIGDFIFSKLMNYSKNRWTFFWNSWTFLKIHELVSKTWTFFQNSWTFFKFVNLFQNWWTFLESVKFSFKFMNFLKFMKFSQNRDLFISLNFFQFLWPLF